MGEFGLPSAVMGVASIPHSLVYFILFWSTVDLRVVLVSGVRQSESVIHIHVSTLFQILFPNRLLQNIE